MEINTNGRNWYTVEEFAQLLELKPETIYRWGKNNVIKTFKVTPRRVGIPVSEYKKYLKGELMKKGSLTCV